MLTPTPVADQVAAVAADPVRVLVVGAGAAGRAIAGLLRRRGLHPVLVERARPGADDGYMLALMPLADDVLDALGVRDAYRAASTPLRRYRLRGSRGGMLRTTDMARLLGDDGEYRGIGRGALLDVLGAGGGPVSHGTTVEALTQDGDTVRVRLRHDAGADTPGAGAGSTELVVDAVVLADGLRSRTRDLVLDPAEVTTYDTGWDGWVAWGGPPDDPWAGDELWGDGLFLGTYPVLRDGGRVDGIILCGPRAQADGGPARLVATARARTTRRDPAVERSLDLLAGATERYRWRLDDRRAARWATGRVVLLGDAAAGFLPTAGIGACMALESAGVLAGHLAAADAASVPRALRDYETAQRPRAEAAQDNSRALARLMFRRGRAVATLRDAVARVLPARTVLRPIRGLLDTRPGAGADAGVTAAP